jgi:glycosyltransferase involved in cell wall biosynthesis
MLKIAVFSDTRLPTNPAMPGHGLGQIAHSVATGLLERGHDVTLFAGGGSAFTGKLLVEANESDFLRYDLAAFDAIIDNTHQHVTGKIAGLPAAQVSHDREHTPTANAVFPSKAHRDWHGLNAKNSRIVHNGVVVPELPKNAKKGGYAAYLSTFFAPKAPLMAAEAARLAGVKLYAAGPTPPEPPPGADYIGPVTGDDKLAFFAGADCLLFGASTECAPVTVLEAQAAGCPVIVAAYGGASENMADGITGYVVRDTLEMVDAIGNVGKISREDCREWVRANRSRAQMIDGYEALVKELASGRRW